ncbi:hypothetical protein B0H67DRAFT_551620 [Lasiosphaeris hirsuta]|uniref:Uncharacterized protein n=1 Tax=Lasiosphaeris hirsuta TaxID=260670 RepID=A0AA40ANS0_9PEZI|nr:hypothetical protein B0H67DRAFT_551620 [Lasiosphaeris hirsuta]
MPRTPLDLLLRAAVTGERVFCLSPSTIACMFPFQDATVVSQLYDQFLSVAGVSSYAQARTKSSEVLVGIQAGMIVTAPFESTVFGPNTDGLMVPDHPGKLLTAGKVDKRVKVIVAHNLEEGLLSIDQANVANVNGSGAATVRDPSANGRCK